MRCQGEAGSCILLLLLLPCLTSPPSPPSFLQDTIEERDAEMDRLRRLLRSSGIGAGSTSSSATPMVAAAGVSTAAAVHG